MRCESIEDFGVLEESTTEVSCAETKKNPGRWESYVPAWFGMISHGWVIDFSAALDGKLELNEVSFEPIARERESGGLPQQGRWARKFTIRGSCIFDVPPTQIISVLRGNR